MTKLESTSCREGCDRRSADLVDCRAPKVEGAGIRPGGRCSYAEPRRGGNSPKAPWRGLLFGLGVVLWALMPAAVFGARVFHSELGFELRIPESFELYDEGRVSPDVTHSLVDRKPSGERIFFLVERLHRTVSRAELRQREPPTGATVEQMVWRGHILPVVRIPESVEGNLFVSWTVDVPIFPESIRLRIVGDASQELASRQILSEALASLVGESAWPEPTPGSRATLWLLAIVASVVLGMMIFRLRRR